MAPCCAEEACRAAQLRLRPATTSARARFHGCGAEFHRWKVEAARHQSVRRTSFTLHTSTAAPSDTDPSSKVAATVTRQPFILGSFRVALAFGASGPAWLTGFASAVTVMVVAGIARPFTTVTTVAARGLGGFAGTRGSAAGVAGGALGAAAVAGGPGGAISTGVGAVTMDVRTGAVAGGGAGAVSTGSAGIVIASGGAAAGDPERMTSTGADGVPSGSAAVCARAAANGRVAETRSVVRATRVIQEPSSPEFLGCEPRPTRPAPTSSRQSRCGRVHCRPTGFQNAGQPTWLPVC